MGLMQKAVETYQQHADRVGVYYEGKTVLAPVSHAVKLTRIEVTIQDDGEFLAASVSEQKVLIPVTMESAGRTSKKAATIPHPLSDKLSYYIQQRELVMQQLKRWADSPYGHSKIDAILAYLERGTLVEDLLRCGCIKMGKKGLSHTDWVVRWRVHGAGEESACWKDQSLFRAFAQYYQSTLADAATDLCMITGETDVIAEMHPKGILAQQANAKLISSNDTTNFTYRGRFTEERQAATIGYQASQKAHNALTWLAAEQGVVWGDRTFLCWNPKGITVPSPTMGLLGPDEPTVQPSDYQRQLKKALEGYRTRLPEQEDVIIAVFDAATSGRLAVTYYNELRGSDFLQRLYHWDRQCCWYNWNFGVQSPLLHRIVNCAYGTQREGTKKGEKGITLETDDKLMRQQVQRILACRVDQVAVSRELVDMLVNRASMPQSFEERIWKEILFTACAMVNLKIQETGGENVMSWRLDTKDRDFQYGRLLAVYEKAERDTYDKDETREPNAMRLMTMYRKRPYETMAILEEQLVRAYLPKLLPPLRANYKKCIGEIMRCLTECEGYEGKQMNEPLKPNYLLGYYLQRMELYQKKNQEEEQK